MRSLFGGIKIQKTSDLGGAGVRVADQAVPDVDPHVFAQQAGPQEALGADAAGVRLVGQVDLLVRSQVGGGGEGLAAHRAAVQLLRRVDLHVLLQAGRPRVALAADGTGVELLLVGRRLVCPETHDVIRADRTHLN